MRNIYSVILILFFTGINCLAQSKQPVDYVDPMIGTADSRWMLFPGVTMPSGMVNLSPDNQNQGWKAGYEYSIENSRALARLKLYWFDKFEARNRLHYIYSPLINYIMNKSK